MDISFYLTIVLTKDILDFPNMTQNLILNAKLYSNLNQLQNEPKNFVKLQSTPCDQTKKNKIHFYEYSPESLLSLLG